MESYDVVVIGGGPGGYVAAIKAAQLGLKTACVEARSTLGGTCLNEGCIPSKALLHATEQYAHLPALEAFGISVGTPKIDLKKLLAHKDSTVTELTKGIDFLFKKNKVTRYVGWGSFKDAHHIEIKSDGAKTETIHAKNIIIATGSKVAEIPSVPLDEKIIVSSRGALSLSKVPKKMVVIGGGYIGLEMASVWQRLGSTVHVIEDSATIIPMMDKDLSSGLLKSLKKQGLTFHLNTRVRSAEKKGKKAILSFGPSNNPDAPAETMDVDCILVAVGRRPNTDNLGLDHISLTPNQRGMIEVNDQFQTKHPHIYAIGDVVTGPMLAHKAEEEGVAAVEFIAGQKPVLNHDTIPSVIYTSPEAAAVGKTEQELKAAGVDYKVGKFSFAANSRAKANHQTEGFVKMLTDAQTDRILGVHILSHDAGTLIAEAVLAMEYHATAEDIARTCHAHPTTSEALKEAALAAHFKAIHA